MFLRKNSRRCELFRLTLWASVRSQVVTGTIQSDVIIMVTSPSQRFDSVAANVARADGSHLYVRRMQQSLRRSSVTGLLETCHNAATYNLNVYL